MWALHDNGSTNYWRCAGPGRQWEGKAIMSLKVTRSSGNVFRDLGFRREEAEHLLVRADLLIHVQKLIASRQLKQREAAALLRISQPRVSDLVRGRIDLFSTDMLIDMLARLGTRVRLAVKSDRQNRKVA
jgi:predicted XRE-type DNA-binding protein